MLDSVRSNSQWGTEKNSTIEDSLNNGDRVFIAVTFICLITLKES